MGTRTRPVMSNATEGMGDVPLFINRGARNRPRFQKLDADEAIWKCASKPQNPRVGNVRGTGFRTIVPFGNKRLIVRPSSLRVCA